MKVIRLLPVIILIAIVTGLQAQTDKDFKKFSKFIQMNNTEKVLKLIDKGKNINAQDDMGKTPLLYSLELGKADFAEIFINAGANINIYDVNMNGCLHYSIEHCRGTDIIYKLIDMGADINLRNTKLYTPFHFSILYKCPEIPFYLIKKGADYKTITLAGENAIHLAVEAGCDTLLSFLMKQGLDYNLVDKNGNTPFMVAISNNETDIAYELMDLGVDINIADVGGNTPLLIAIKRDQDELAGKLMDMGADVNAADNTGNTPLLVAVKKNQISIAEKLINKGADVNIADRNGNTPLLIAAKENRNEIAEKLINAGADVNCINNENNTPVYYAVINCNRPIFDRLINKGVNVDIEFDGTPLIYLAVDREDKYVVEMLLLNGAKNPMLCDVHDICYKTAFIYSVSAGIADEGEKLSLYQNSLNIYNLAREKYKDELSKIRAKNTGKLCGEICLMFAASASNTYYYSDPNVDYEADRIAYLKNRIEKCDARIAELESTISALK
jgi:ankyrin repeat protein